MESPMMNVTGDQSRFKTSISTRLIAAFVYMIPAVGGALSSLYLINFMQALRNNETAGLTTLFKGLTESTTPALGSLYFGAFCGLLVIVVLIVRMFIETTTASPSSWFFIFCGFLFLVPAGLFFEAESMIIEALTIPDSSTNIAQVGANVSSLLILSVASTVVVFMVMLIMSVIPFSTASKPKWSSLITAIFVEFLIIAAAIAFQLRFLWLYKAGSSE